MRFARVLLKLLPLLLFAAVPLFAQAASADDLRSLLLKAAELDSQRRYGEAEIYYQRALKVAPNSAQVFNNLGNHYLASGDRSQARKFYLQAVAVDPHHANANLQLAQMSLNDQDGEQALAYLSRLRNSGSPDADVALLKARAHALIGMAFAQRKIYHQAEASFSRALESDPANFEILYNLGLASLEAGHPDRAATVLERALKERPDDPDCGHALARARLDLAIVRFQRQGAEAALSELDQTPPTERKGDYYLMRAQILDSMGKTQDAVDALNRGMRAAPTRSDLYLEAAGFLLKHNLLHEASDLLNQASLVLPSDRELLLAQVVTLELLRREVDAQNLLAKIQARWPKWDRAYQLRGMLLEMQLKSFEARTALETAIALGANTPEVYYYEALAITHDAPDDLDAAENAIHHALALTSTDPYVFVLAGRIAISKRQYAKAVQYLLAASRLQPTLIPAHYGLREAYKALGEEQKSTAEMEEIKRLARENQAEDPNPFASEGLFAVRPPS